MNWKDWVASWPGQVWEFLKKVPGWVFLVVSLLIAVIVWLVQRQQRIERLAQLDKMRAEIDRVHEAEKKEALEEKTITLEQVEANFREATGKINDAEAEIEVAAAEGPAALAKKWNESFAKRRGK